MNTIRHHFSVFLQLTRRQIELGKTERSANIIAYMSGEEERESLDSQITVAVVVTRRRVNLRVRVEVANALYVDDHHLVVGTLVGEVRERLWRRSHVFGVVHKARVRVVLDVLAFDVVLEVKERRTRSVDELEYGELEHVDLFGRVMAIVDLRPQFRVHLQLHVVEVALAWDAFVFVAFRYVVARVRPTLCVKHVRELLHSKARSHSTLLELLRLNLHRALVFRPYFLNGVISMSNTRFLRARIELEVAPRITERSGLLSGHSPSQASHANSASRATL